MTADSPKKSLVGRLFRLLLILIVIVIALVALAPTLFSGFVKDKITSSMEESLDAKVTMEDFSFGWFSGTEIGGFDMTRTGEDKPALSIGHLSTDPSYREILSGKFIVEDIVAQDVTIRVSRDESGVDWKDIRKPQKKSTPKKKQDTDELPEFLVRAQIKNLRVIYDDPKLNHAIDLAGMDVNLRAGRSEGCSIKLTGPHGIAADISVEAFKDNRLLATDEMTASGTLDVASLNLGDFAPHLGQFVADLQGTLTTNQKISYGPDGKVEVKGPTKWQGLVAKSALAGISSKTGSCDSLFVLSEDGDKEVTAKIRLNDSDVVGLPKQKQAVPCGKGSLDIVLAANQVLTLTNGKFDIPGGRLSLNGTYGMGEVQGRGIKLDGATDLALWSAYFEEIPDLKGKVKVNGTVPADMTKTPVLLNVDVADLRLTGGPLEDKAYNCGHTTADMKITMPATPGGPQKFDIKTKSRMWQIDMKSSLSQDVAAAFGMLGQASIQGNCDLEQILAPFTDSRGQGRVTFDFLADLQANEVRISNAKVSGPATTGHLTAQVGRNGDAWRFVLDGDQFTYKRGDGIGLLMPKLQGRGDWNKGTGAINGRLNLSDVRTIGGAGAPVRGGDVAVEFSGTANQELGRYNLNFSRLDLAGFSGTGKVDYASEKGLQSLSVKGQADYAQLSRRWIRLVDPNAEGSGTGPFILEVTPNGSDWSAAHGRAEMKIPFVKYKGLSVTDMVVKGSMQGGKGKLTEGAGKVNGGTMNLSGDFDLSKEDTIFNATAQLNRVKIVEEWQPAIARVIPLFAGIGVKAEGFIDMDLKANGQGNDWESIKPHLNGDGNIGLGEGRITSSPILETIGMALGFSPNKGIDDIKSAFQIKDGGVHQDGLVAKLAGFELKMAGTTYLDGRLDYDLGFKPTSQSPTNWERYASIIATDGYLPLKLTGTVDSPSPGLPDAGKLIEAGAKKLLGDGLGNLIGGGEKDKKKSGLGGLINGITGGSKQDAKDDGKKKSNDPLGGLLNGLTGGDKDKDKNKNDKKKSNSPLDGILNGLGGGDKKKDPKDDKEKEKKKSPLGGLGGLLGGGN